MRKATTCGFPIDIPVNNKSIPWHLVKSPINNEIFIVLGGTGGEGGITSLEYSVDSISMQWEYYNTAFTTLHGIAVDGLGEYIYVSSRGNHALYQFDASNGAFINSTPLGALGQIVSPGGVAVMQSICTGCE